MNASGNTTTAARARAAAPISRHALSTHASASNGIAPACTTAAVTILVRVVIARLRSRLLLKISVHERDRHAAFADRRRDALDRAQANVAAGEYARHAGFEQIRVARERPATGPHHVVPGEHVATRVARDGGRQPVGLRIGADEHEESAARVLLHATAGGIANVDRRQVRVTVGSDDLGSHAYADVRL